MGEDRALINRSISYSLFHNVFMVAVRLYLFFVNKSKTKIETENTQKALLHSIDPVQGRGRRVVEARRPAFNE